MGSSEERKWWKEAVVLQIWTHSYCDSNGDGVGDLPGVLSKIEYIKELGIDVIWFSPVFPSPMKDFGYDISDFKNIEPIYGTLDDWDRLKHECDKRGMRIIMDLVLNHCSDQHPWFLDAKASRDSKYRNFFYWRNGRNGDGIEPPNNWRSVFGGSAWTYVDETEQWYLHQYHTSQPDLNWESPELRDGVWLRVATVMRLWKLMAIGPPSTAMYDVAEFWLKRGCAGFRLDAVSRLSKAPGLPDAPITEPDQQYQLLDIHCKHGPRLTEFLQELHEKVLSKYDCMTVGEMSSTNPTRALDYIHPDNKVLDMIFQFEHTHLDSQGTNPLKHRKWHLPEFKALTAAWEKMQSDHGGWNSWHKENHDLGRSVSRLGDDSREWRALSAKALAMYDATLPGTLYIYQGEELAMTRFPESFTVADLPDVQTQNYWNDTLDKRRRETGQHDPDMSDIHHDLRIKARDNGRMPVRWDDSQHNAGFTTGTPWMKLNPDDAGWSAAEQQRQAGSVLNFWKRLIALRKAHPVLVYGKFTLHEKDHATLFVYTVSQAQASYLVVMNWSNQPIKGYALPVRGDVELLLGNYSDAERGPRSQVNLRGWEALLYQCTDST